MPFLLLLAIVQAAPSPGRERDPRVLVGTVDFGREEVERILELSLPPPPDDPTNAVYGDEAAARLGQALFFDRRLSSTGTIACATCHVPERGWSDGKALAEGQVTLTRHTMTLWNAAYNRWFFWDGRRDSLWAQALTPLEDAREHAFSRLELAHLLADDPGYRRAYEDVFGELPPLADRERFPPAGRPVDGDPDHPHAAAWNAMRIGDQQAVERVFANAGKAIAAFERRIVSRDSPFDRWVAGLREGDPVAQDALGDPARRGLALFLGKARCHLCHDGALFSDREFHNDRIPPLEGGLETDPGRLAGIEAVRSDPFNGVGGYSDAPDGSARDKLAYLVRDAHNRNEFKTPSLRNVAVTAPYMHNGRFATLEEVIGFYSTLEGALPRAKSRDRLLVALDLTDAERADLLAFLESLTDTELPPALTRAPRTPYLMDQGD